MILFVDYLVAAVERRRLVVCSLTDLKFLSVFLEELDLELKPLSLLLATSNTL